jgi:hypothetical protein
MGMFRPEIGPFLIERRRRTRSRATCAASIETPAGELFGQLWDLSETGARVQTADPPGEGTVARLKWASEKVACQVVWARDDMCGLGFESPINREVVSATTRVIGGSAQPAASLANIPLGRKRSASL